jgi:DNA/RNA endonuclease YhcR with UshA esterase domain
MKLFTLLLLSFSFLNSYAQKEIKLEELKDHIGDSVILQGKISEVHYLESAKNKPTLINIGGVYPNQLLTIVIREDVRSQLHLTPSSKDIGNKVWVAGKIEVYNNKLQIVIRQPKQIDIIQDSQGDLDLE